MDQAMSAGVLEQEALTEQVGGDVASLKTCARELRSRSNCPFEGLARASHRHWAAERPGRAGAALRLADGGVLRFGSGLLRFLCQDALASRLAEPRVGWSEVAR